MLSFPLRVVLLERPEADKEICRPQNKVVEVLGFL